MPDIDTKALREAVQAVEHGIPYCGLGESHEHLMTRRRAADSAGRDLVAAAPALLHRIEALEAELAAIDSLLARRSALDGCDTRVERVQRCIDAAAVADPSALTAKLVEARKEAGKWRSDHDRAEAELAAEREALAMMERWVRRWRAAARRWRMSMHEWGALARGADDRLQREIEAHAKTKAGLAIAKDQRDNSVRLRKRWRDAAVDEVTIAGRAYVPIEMWRHELQRADRAEAELAAERTRADRAEADLQIERAHQRSVYDAMDRAIADESRAEERMDRAEAVIRDLRAWLYRQLHDMAGVTVDPMVAARVAAYRRAADKLDELKEAR